MVHSQMSRDPAETTSWHVRIQISLRLPMV